MPNDDDKMTDAGPIRSADDTAEVTDAGGVGAEGSTDAGKLPAEPLGGAEDTPLGDTDQHSQVTDSEHDEMKR